MSLCIPYTVSYDTLLLSNKMDDPLPNVGTASYMWVYIICDTLLLSKEIDDPLPNIITGCIVYTVNIFKDRTTYSILHLIIRYSATMLSSQGSKHLNLYTYKLYNTCPP